MVGYSIKVDDRLFIYFSKSKNYFIMSIVGGAFDETRLLNFIVKADEVSFDSRIKQQYMPKADALMALMSLQNANVLSVISNSRKDVDVEVEWMNTCDITVSDNVDCVLGGEEASTNVQEYSLSNEKVVAFTADETKFVDNRYNIEESIAKQFLQADKQLTEWFNNYSIGRLNTFLGVNVYDGDKGVVGGTDTFIKAPYWNADLMAYMHKVSIMNRMDNVMLLSGHNLFTQNYLASAKIGNADGKGEPALFGTIPIAFDLFNIDTVNTPDQVTYMLQYGSLAFASKSYNPDIPQVVNGVFTRYTMESRFMPNVKYDVFYKAECTTGDKVVHNFKVKLKADVFLNPTGCSGTNTGVLRFVCGESQLN